MNKDVLKKYFDLSCSNECLEQIRSLEIQFSISVPEDYQYVMKSLCFKEEFKLGTFCISNVNLTETHFFSFGTLEDLLSVVEMTKSTREIESRLREEEVGFKGFDLDKCIYIATLISRNSDLYEGLFLDCSDSENRGSLYLVDLNLYYDLNENGNPLKVQISNSIAELIEIIDEQQDQIPIEYRI